MIIQTSIPVMDGLYIVYVDGLSLEWKNPYLVTWYRGEWFHRFSSEKYSDRVQGWIGPLPTLKVDKTTQMDFDL